MAPSRWARLRASASTNWPVLVVVAGVVVVAGSWALRERAVPPWDQAVYLRNGWHLSQELGHGPRAFVDAIFTTSPERAPLLGIALVPFIAVLGASASSALVLNILLWPVLLVVTGAIAAELFGRSSRLLAVVVTATMPLVVGMSRLVFQEFLLTTLAVITVWLALRSRGFTDRPASLGLGIVVGLGTLTKLVFPIYVVGPLLVIALEGFRRRAGDSTHRPVTNRAALNLAWAVALAVVLAGCWYGPSWSDTRRYLALNTSDSSATAGAGRSFSRFVLELLNASVSWWFALAGLVALAIVLPRALRRLRGRSLGWGDLRGAAILAAWVVVPLAVVASGKLQTQRYLTALTPAIAIGLAALLARIPTSWVRRALITVVVVAGIAQTMLLSFPVHEGSEALTFPTPFGTGWIPLAGQQQGYDRLPNPVDHATPIVEYLERMSCDAAGEVTARRIGLLQTNPVTNDATMALVAQLRGDPFHFRRQFADPRHLGALERDLARYDFLLYVPPRPGPPPSSEPGITTGERASMLNRTVYAGAHVTAEQLAAFAGPSRSFPIGGGERVEVLAREAGAPCAVRHAASRRVASRRVASRRVASRDE